MIPKDGKPYVWVSWLSKLLAQDDQCHYAAMIKSRYRYEKRPDPTFDVAAWSEQHTQLLAARANALMHDGWTISLENENAFRLIGTTAILGGKPDAIARKDDRVRIVDAKTGAQRRAHFWQVLLYLYAVPRKWPEYAHALIDGEVCYGTPDALVPVAVPAYELTSERVKQFGALIQLVATHEFAPTPSAVECRYCDIAACAARIVEPAPALATDF